MKAQGIGPLSQVIEQQWSEFTFNDVFSLADVLHQSQDLVSLLNDLESPEDSRQYYLAMHAIDKVEDNNVLRYLELSATETCFGNQLNVANLDDCVNVKNVRSP